MLFPENKEIDLSISIVSYNVRDLLDECLGSIVTNTRGIKYEIIVVDNASRDGTGEMLSRKYPQVRLVPNFKNRGFAAAQNMGLSRGRGRYLFSLDSDTYIKEDTFSAMVRFMDEHPEAGAAGAKLLSPQGVRQYSRRRFPPSVWPVIYRGTFLKKLLPPSRQVRYYEMSDVVLKEEAEVDWLYGGNIIFRREALEEIGLFDERFFIYCEDIDISYRMQEHGWKRYFVPRAEIYHYGQQGTKQIRIKSYLRHVSSYIKLFKKYDWRLKATAWTGLYKDGPAPEIQFLLMGNCDRQPIELCLDAIYSHPPSCSFRVMVVDQASREDTVRNISGKYPEVAWLRNSTPVPVLKAAEQALKMTSSKYLVMVPARPEAVFGQFDQLKAFMDLRPRTGMVGLVHRPDGIGGLPPRNIDERELYLKTCMMIRRNSYVNNMRKHNYGRKKKQFEWCSDYQSVGYSVHYLVNI